MHGFLQLRSQEGRILASGDSVQVSHGDEVTTRTLFNFKDGSVDDETTVFSQRGALRLISDRHLQKGPSFPHPMDVLIDARKRQVTIRSTGKDGREEVRTDHLDLPPDLANGIIPLVIENIGSGVTSTTVPLLVASPRPRLVKLVISPHGRPALAVVGPPQGAPL